MANPNEVQDQIIAAIEAINGIEFVGPAPDELFSLDAKSMPAKSPSVFVDLAESEPTGEIYNSDQIQMECSWEILIITKKGRHAKDLQKEAKAIAFKVMLALNKEEWLTVPGADCLEWLRGVSADINIKHNRGAEAWLLQYRQTVYMGEIPDESATVDEVVYSTTPKTGLAHEPDYQPLDKPFVEP